MSPGAGTGMAHRAAGHAGSTANVTEMTKATETQQMGMEGVLFCGNIQATSWGKLCIYHSWRDLFRLVVTHPLLMSH